MLGVLYIDSVGGNTENFGYVGAKLGSQLIIGLTACVAEHGHLYHGAGLGIIASERHMAISREIEHKPIFAFAGDYLYVLSVGFL